MIRILFGALVLLSGCGADTTSAPASAPARSTLRDDLVAYASASCFAVQPNAYLKDQGQRWAGAILQGAHGPVEPWTDVAAAVRTELERSGIAQGQGDGPQAATIALPVMTCGRIADTTAVRQSIDAAARALTETR